MKVLRLNTCSAILLLTLSLSGPVVAAGRGVAYVSNQDGGVTVIDLDSMETKGSVGIDAKGPRGIGITSDGLLLVTANKDDGYISVVDTSAGKLVKHITIGKNPEFVRVIGNLAYVTYEPSAKSGAPQKPGAASAKDEKDEKDDDNVPGHIAIVDLLTGKVIHDITGKPETEGVEFSKDGKKMIVTNESDSKGPAVPY